MSWNRTLEWAQWLERAARKTGKTLEKINYFNKKYIKSNKIYYITQLFACFKKKIMRLFFSGRGAEANLGLASETSLRTLVALALPLRNEVGGWKKSLTGLLALHNAFYFCDWSYRPSDHCFFFSYRPATFLPPTLYAIANYLPSLWISGHPTRLRVSTNTQPPGQCK